MKSTQLILLMLCLSATAFAADPTPLPIGSKAPNFSLPAVDGKTYSLKDFSNYKILAIIFTCNHCPTAQAYEDRIKQLVTDYSSKGVGIIAISPNDPLAIRLDELGYTDLSDTFEDMKVRAKDKQYNFPYLFDGETSTVSMQYGPQATPHVFIFDQQRMLRYTGRIDDGEKPGTAKTHDTRNALDNMLAGKPVTVDKTKTFGCSVKWPGKREYVEKASAEWAKEKVAIEDLNIDQLNALIKNEGVNYRLINVWATWCGPCVTEFPEFINMNRMYRNREFELITITLDDVARKQNALNFLVKKQASAKNYIFNGDKYAFIEGLDKKWEGSLPYTLFIAPGGKIIYAKQGLIDPLEMKRIIANHLGRIY
ncbi:MAG TPA: redoxin domain-containing protein [Chryseolinea sp.]|mgnify:CR=1 FL=1|nr:redoxin domain-containing protein [Chryseolinea sp.]HPH46525.1 redoxin domain-containing protein [Chryseolinea sp.]HPM32562.1 redoxin domain-containing protein [Chryseolinea sp.]